MTNVVRFPIEERAKPTVFLLYDIMPDSRMVGSVAEAFFLEPPSCDTRDDADKAMAEYILNNVRPESGPERRAALDELLRPLMVEAVNACRLEKRAKAASEAAAERLLRAQTEGGYWIEPLQEAAERLAYEWAAQLIEAQIFCDEAMGASRAVGLAKSGEPWSPVDHAAETDALIADELAARARRALVSPGG